MAERDRIVTDRPRSVLVIDDNINLARGFGLSLEHDGYRVHVAHTAEDGLCLAQREHPDAIVLDLRMPFINGLGYLYRLRELSGLTDTPVLVITGGAVDEETRCELAGLGATVRFKPVSMTELLTEVGALLGRRRGVIPPATWHGSVN
jgi:two-component system KDP operon response regulator KdpE